MSPGQPSKELVAAYQATQFVVFSEPARVFAVGEGAAAVTPWLASVQASCAAIITAWNPFSRPTEVADNLVRQEALQRAVRSASLRWLNAEGRDPTGAWLPEPSFCVLDASVDVIDAWLVTFEQYAVVRLDSTVGCSLVWHPGCR